MKITGVIGSLQSMPGSVVPGTTWLVNVPIPSGIYLEAPPGWQPWNVASMWQVISWDTEAIPTSGYANPPPPNTPVLAATVNMTSYTLKVWMPLASVTPLA